MQIMKLCLVIFLGIFLSACAQRSIDSPISSVPELTEDDELSLFKPKTPQETQLLSCYVVMSYQELIYTKAYFDDLFDSVLKRSAVELAADRIRNWPLDGRWQIIDARYATITIGKALGDEISKTVIRKIISVGLSPSAIKRLAIFLAIEAAVVESIIDAIKLELNDKTMTAESRVNSCIDRIDVTNDRLKALIGLGS